MHHPTQRRFWKTTALPRLAVCSLVAVAMQTPDAAADIYNWDTVHAGDVILNYEQGQIHTGTVLTGDDGRYWAPERVFIGESGGVDAFDFTDEPGFDAPAGMFSDVDFLSFNVLTPLRRWNADTSAFDVLDRDTQEYLDIRRGGSFVQTGSELVAGFNVPPSGGGAYHRHLGFTLLSDGAAPRDGVYLLELEKFVAGDHEQSVSDPFWILLHKNAWSDMDDAEQYVRTVIVPEPTSVALLGFGAAGLLLRRRR